MTIYWFSKNKLFQLLKCILFSHISLKCRQGTGLVARLKHQVKKAKF